MRRTVQYTTGADGKRQLAEDERCPENITAICQSRQAPGFNGSDAALVADLRQDHQFDRMPAGMRDKYLSAARAAGISTHGKEYVPSLARHGMGGGRDPLAWVPMGDGARAHVKQVCEMTNRDCNGMVEHKAVETAPTPAVPLAEDLIQRKVKEIVAKEPNKKKDLRAVREEVIHKHAPAHRRK